LWIAISIFIIILQIVESGAGVFASIKPLNSPTAGGLSNGATNKTNNAPPLLLSAFARNLF